MAKVAKTTARKFRSTVYACEDNEKATIFDLKSILSADGTDSLMRNNGEWATIANLFGKTVALFFSSKWCGASQRFMPIFLEVYDEIRTKGDFEVIFVSIDKDEESFNEYFSKMPWLAVPFHNSEIRDRLNHLFAVYGKDPYLVILDGNGKALTYAGVALIKYYGVEAYPFTPEKLNQITEEEKAAKRNQSLSTLLVSKSRNYLISSDEKKVPISDIEGKTVALYFCCSSGKVSRRFTRKLVEMYNKLKGLGKNFEAVLISDDEDEQAYKEDLKTIPFLAMPFMDRICEKLINYFGVITLPTLVIIGPDGKTLNTDAIGLVKDYGIQAYPFTPERLEELADMERRLLEFQTLESLLVSRERDFVINKDGAKVPISDLVGNNILLYFSRLQSPHCWAFLQKLIKAYREIKARDMGFEIIFIPNEINRKYFDDSLSVMPWLSFPFRDPRIHPLRRKFNILCSPSIVAIGPTGKTVTDQAMELLLRHGPDAYPFTEEHLIEMKAKIEEEAKTWPKNVTHTLHVKHELKLECRNVFFFLCLGCNEAGGGWSYYCEKCDVGLHPKCALKKD